MPLISHSNVFCIIKVKRTKTCRRGPITKQKLTTISYALLYFEIMKRLSVALNHFRIQYLIALRYTLFELQTLLLVTETSKGSLFALQTIQTTHFLKETLGVKSCW